MLTRDNMKQTKGKIYLCAVQHLESGDILGVALAEDGSIVTHHLSSSLDFLKSDLGFTSRLKHDLYKQHFPDGFELIWVANVAAYPEMKEAIVKARKRYYEMQGN